MPADLRSDDPRVVRAWRQLPEWAAATLVAGADVVAVWLLFPARADYVAHFLAGAAGAMFLRAVLPAALRLSGVPAAAWLAIGVAVGVDVVVFDTAVDGMDVAMTGLGAGFAASWLLRLPAPAPGQRVWLGVTAVLLGTVAVVYRYDAAGALF